MGAHDGEGSWEGGEKVPWGCPGATLLPMPLAPHVARLLALALLLTLPACGLFGGDGPGADGGGSSAGAEGPGVESAGFGSSDGSGGSTDAEVPSTDSPTPPLPPAPGRLASGPFPDVALPTAVPAPAPPAPGEACPPDHVLLPGATDVVLGEADPARADACACDPYILRAATFSAVPPVCMATHPFPGAGQPWPSDPFFATPRFSVVQDLRQLLPRWGRRLCTWSESLLAMATPANHRFVGGDSRQDACPADPHAPEGVIGSHPDCATASGVVDPYVRSEYVELDSVGATVLAGGPLPEVQAGMLLLTTANTGGGDSTANDNYGFHAHVYPWGFFDVGDPPGDGYVDDGLRVCATPSAAPPAAPIEAEYARLRERFSTWQDWVALWSVPTTAPLSSDRNWTAVRAARNHSCGLRSDGSLRCWGSDVWGESSPPEGTYTDLALGWRHGCALATDGSLRCWGDDARGQATPPPGTYSAVGAGDFFSCALTTDGHALCWGNVGRDSWRLPPPDQTFSALGVGDRHACGITTDDAVVCWGDERFPQGQPPAEYAFVSLEMGYEEACGVTTEGTVACWGNLDRVPRALAGAPGSAVSSGHRMRCVLRDQRLTCDDDLTPARWEAPEAPLVSVDLGFAHGCGVQPDGHVRCWGGDVFGQASPP